MNDRRNFLTTLALAASAQAQTRAPARLAGTQSLPAPFEGWEASFIEVTAGAGSAPPHRHAGFVLGYVIDGEFRFATHDQPERVIPAGGTFYEPPGSVHTVSASAKADRPAKILAIIIAEKGKELTTFEK